MSSFLCDHCGAECLDSSTGYRSGCSHYPIQLPAFLAGVAMPTIIAGGRTIDD